MFTVMFTMSAREIKDALRRNRRDGREPSSLSAIARMKGVPRSLMTMAVKNPRRYPGARRYIEAALVAPERRSA